MIWVALARRGRDPSIPAKFGLALVQLGAGYGVLVLGAAAGIDGIVSLVFLVLCYLLHTTGELCLSPVGLSAVTKLAPPKIVGMVMGAWFLSIATAHKIAGYVNALAGVKPEFTKAMGIFDGLEKLVKKGELTAGSPEYAAKTTELIEKAAKGNTEMEATLTQLLGSPEAEVTKQTLEIYLNVYSSLCWIAVGAGILLMMAAPFLKKWQHGVK
jgi:dipeptide/tripeptide permease